MDTPPTSARMPPDGLPPSLGKPALRALASMGITDYGDLGRWSAAELLALHGVGPKAVGILAAGLAARNSGFAPDPGATGS